MTERLCMLWNEDCRTAVFGKTERTVGWEGDGELVMAELVRHCYGKLAETDRLSLTSLSHSFTLDILVHCKSEQQAKYVLAAIQDRLAHCKLELHPDKTRIVYCKDGKRKGSHEHERLDFLGFTFRPRLSKDKKGRFFVNFSPAISDKARKNISSTIRSWRIHRCSGKTLAELAQMVNPRLQGWINYYGSFYKSCPVGKLAKGRIEIG